MTRTVGVAVLITVLGCFVAPANAEPAVAALPAPKEPVQYVGPDTYILLDAAGRGQPVLGMAYEEFMAAWKETQGRETQVAEPRYSIEELQLKGEANDDHAELVVTLTIRLSTDATVKIPLGMAKGILRDSPDWERVDHAKVPSASAAPNDGGVKDFSPQLSFQPERGGFVVRLDGQPDTSYRLTLHLLVPLVQNAGEATLALNLPRALVSKLALDVPQPITAASVSGDALLAREPIPEGGTRLLVTGLAGDTRLAWSTIQASRAELATVLSATGSIDVSIDGHSVRSTALVNVRSFGGSFDRFRIRLPPGAQLLQPESQTDATATVPDMRIAIDDDGPRNDNRQVVVVELSERQAGPVEVQLATEQPLGLPGTDLAVDLGGFEVLGAVRQFGDVTVRVVDDWQLRWDVGQNVRQVERRQASIESRATSNDSSTTSTDELNPVAAFQYDRAPWSLRVQVIARPFRVQVTPEYVLELDAGEARLLTKLVYQVPGARAFEFRVQLNGWDLTPEPIESDAFVDRHRVQVTSEGLLKLPLLQASPRRAEIAFVLRRELASAIEPGKLNVPTSVGPVELPLPVPEADTVAAANLTVVSPAGTDVELDGARSAGLSPVPVTDETLLSTTAADGQQEYRYRVAVPDAVFAATRTIRERTVDAEITTQLTIDADRIIADQTFEFWVRNQPIDQLSFSLPAGWQLVDEEVDLPTDRIDTVGPAAESEIRVSLPQPRMGRFQSRLKFVLERPDESSFVGPLQLTLPSTTIGDVSAHQVIISTSPNLAASLNSTASASTWQPVGDSTDQLVVGLISDGNEATLPLAIQQVDPTRLQQTRVERVWLQTWLADSTTQERAAFRFRTNGSSAAVELPPGVPPDEVEVMLDGHLAEVSSRGEGRVVVELAVGSSSADLQPRFDSAEPHTLELRYRRSTPTSWLARGTYTPPQLASMSSLGEVYWQWILPAGVHVLRTPAPLAAVDRWQWLGEYWGRQPLLGQAELEKWAGAASREFAPSPQQTTYLFSGLAPVASIEIVTAPRWLVLLAASGAVLGVVCAWIYLPILRRAWVGLLLAALIAVLAITFPIAAVLLGQAALVGLVLALLAVALRSWLDRPKPPLPLTTGSTRLRLRAPSRSDSYAPSPTESSASRTPATPVSVPETD